ncbi:MAG: hypothetical protein U9O87_00630 [Verrucomicrobiota bacterium]|nr:hypothetical protein [Verrucomicrobiota bacterium]
MKIKKILICIIALTVVVFSGCKRYLEESTPAGSPLPEIEKTK